MIPLMNCKNAEDAVGAYLRQYPRICME